LTGYWAIGDSLIFLQVNAHRKIQAFLRVKDKSKKLKAFSLFLTCFVNKFVLFEVK